MSEYVKIGMRADLPESGQVKEFSTGGRLICVTNVGGRFSAMNNVCIHRGAPLGQGSVERGNVVCPWHGWEFDPFTGAAAHNRQHCVPVYQLRFEEDGVFVRIDSQGAGSNEDVLQPDGSLG